MMLIFLHLAYKPKSPFISGPDHDGAGKSVDTASAQSVDARPNDASDKDNDTPGRCGFGDATATGDTAAGYRSN